MLTSNSYQAPASQIPAIESVQHTNRPDHIVLNIPGPIGESTENPQPRSNQQTSNSISCMKRAAAGLVVLGAIGTAVGVIASVLTGKDQIYSVAAAAGAIAVAGVGTCIFDCMKINNRSEDNPPAIEPTFRPENQPRRDEATASGSNNEGSGVTVNNTTGSNYSNITGNSGAIGPGATVNNNRHYHMEKIIPTEKKN